MPLRITGRVAEVTGLTVVARSLPAATGTMCRIEPENRPPIDAQVVGFSGERTILMPLADPLGVTAGDPVVSNAAMQHVPVGRNMLGRVLDGLGRPIDSDRPIAVEAQYPVQADPPPALSRRPIDTALPTGVRAIDLMLTVGGGQRLGVFAGTGVGKSILMGMIARNTQAAVTVVALVGERGREVGDFIRKDLGEAGLARVVMVVSTSDESPVMRVRASFVATAVAEFFRDQGNDVLLLMDSTTRMAMAQRQIGLAAGEPPATKGYTPSVFALLPRLLERSGRTDRGSITGLYTVLVEGDDINEPISDAIRGILDGHVWLSRAMANRGQYPAVSVLESISRLMPEVVGPEHQAAAQNVKRVLAVWADIEDLVNIGAYARGTNPEYDLAIEMKPRIDELLRQGIDERAGFSESCDALLALDTEINDLRSRLGSQRRPQPRTVAT
ncbi:MAG TPA: FliI/YscN family ATPase [Phycisphaerae bacterium]|nr:FliI/YscN family ATPase [Phycisphaerae bacterium]